MLLATWYADFSFRNYSKLSGSIDPGYMYTAEKSTKDNTRLCSIAVFHTFTIKPFAVMFEIVSIERLYDINEKRKILDTAVCIAYKANRRGFLTRNSE